MTPPDCPLDIDPIEIGKLIQKIETLDESVRTRLVNFIFNMLEIDEFEVGEVNSYLR